LALKIYRTFRGKRYQIFPSGKGICETNMVTFNKHAVLKNPYQGQFKKVLTVCSAGCLRSPTAAYVLSLEPYNCNTRCAGASDEIAIVPVTAELVEWADEIVCMELHHAERLIFTYAEKASNKITVLGIPDNFAYRDPALMELIKEKYNEAHPGYGA
jgi:predicted protein tyrosine phosphatase